ncbi:hypothetical protein N7454_000248 [Penicillium verhagenii]|nr:hypothetical protein N7454_000248 [Penicillium verhagenii]
MDRPSQIRRYEAVKHLYEKFKPTMPWFFSTGDLQDLGIQTLQIDVTRDGSLQFDPCFFLPHHESVLQKYPIDPVQIAATYPPLHIPQLTSRPDVTSMIQMEEETGIRNEAARATFKSTRELGGPDEWHDHARETHCYAMALLDFPRIGLRKGHSLFSLATINDSYRVLTSIRTKGAISDPQTAAAYSAERVYWRIHGFFEDPDKSLPHPHAIMGLTSDVPVNNARHCLTLHEMQAILSIMVIRTTHRPFRSQPLHPLLVISFAGEKHGRIIQASLHGHRLVVQFSPLWSFTDEKKSTG